MFGWLFMTAILMCVILYTYRSVIGITQKNDNEFSTSFSMIRRKEIEDEVAFGRINELEARQLINDLKLEETNKIGEDRYFPNNRTTQLALTLFLVVTVLGSVTLYENLGFPKEVTFANEVSTQSVTSEKLSKFLLFRANKYDKAEDWYFVAQDYLSQQNYNEALPAFQRALDKMPDDIDNKVRVSVEYAQAIFYSNGQKVNDKMNKLVDDVLLLDPNQAMALGLKGIAEFDNENYRDAVVVWQKAITVGKNMRERSALLEGISKAREVGNISESDVPSLVQKRLTIKIDTSNIQSIDPQSIFLVYAKLPSQPMPIAIKRLTPNEIVDVIELTNLDNLMPGTTLADADKVDVIVKLSKLTDTDLTQGKVVGSKEGVLVDKADLLIIPVTL
ncbi:tetratricopeptide repeat protein [Marinomonas sp. 2405UD68-3]|uniref:tetratricopeptide repeat protein n=1 Tax=Marinomonas sp. 2405UD68-3 TaxID=3391835 RepID=UPI0039C91605